LGPTRPRCNRSCPCNQDQQNQVGFTATLSYSVLSYPYPTLPYPILSDPIRSDPILFYPILSYPILSYPILSYPILSYPILSYPILSYPILPYPTLSFHVVSLRRAPLLLTHQALELSDAPFFPDHVFTLSRAGVLAGVHGAGLANMLLMDPGLGGVVEVWHGMEDNYHYGVGWGGK
jgi:hypothetical protein